MAKKKSKSKAKKAKAEKLESEIASRVEQEIGKLRAEQERKDAEAARLRAEQIREEDKIDSASQAQAAQFDKAILTVSAALFGLTFGVFNVIEVPAIWIECLVATWTFLCFSVLATLLSFLTSQEALNHNLSVIRGDVEYEPPPQWTRCLNWISFCLFGLGLVFFCIFVGVNMTRDKTLQPDKGASGDYIRSVKGGYEPSTPLKININLDRGGNDSDSSADSSTNGQSQDTATGGDNSNG